MANLELMQVAPSGGQICKWCHLVAIWWPNLFQKQISPHGGQNWNQCCLHYMLAKFLTNASGILFCWRYNSSFRCYTLGPLCLWQCFGVFSQCNCHHCPNCPHQCGHCPNCPHCLCLCLFVVHVMSPHHSDRMSQMSQVSGIALW